MPTPATVLILGVGNIILSDEAVGVRAVEALIAAYELPPGVQALDGGTSSMEMLDEIADLDLLIVVDALKAGKWDGVMGPVQFADYDGFTNQNNHQMLVQQILGGNYETVLPAQFATKKAVYPFPKWK